jgi:hypothetical protein
MNSAPYATSRHGVPGFTRALLAGAPETPRCVSDMVRKDRSVRKAWPRRSQTNSSVWMACFLASLVKGIRRELVASRVRVIVHLSPLPTGTEDDHWSGSAVMRDRLGSPI